jgi:hypothetical protein
VESRESQTKGQLPQEKNKTNSISQIHKERKERDFKFLERRKIGGKRR